MAVDVNAGTKVLTHEDNQDEESDEFDPWALPELKDLGPKWSGKLSIYFSTFFAQRGRFLSIFIWFDCFPATSNNGHVLRANRTRL